jgi:hypothetical protein
LALTKELLAAAQAQRNQAEQRAHDNLVRRLQSSTGAEAAQIVADLVATPIGGSVPPRKRSEDPKDGLLDPSES